MTAPSARPVSPPSTAILRLTQAEAAGASLKVAGLAVMERAVRQLARVRGLQVKLASDGTIALPSAVLARFPVEVVSSDPGTAVAALARASSDAAAVVIGADVVRRQSDPLTGGIRVENEATRRRAEDGIFADLLRGDLGVIARHINKKISFRITRHLLCKTPVTPNQVTLGAAVIGLLGCVLIARGTYPATVAGFVLAQVQSVLDGCDGELARVRFQQTAIGEWLDTLVDDFLNLSLVASMGIAFWRADHSLVAAIASGGGCAMLLVYNVISYRELVRQGVGGELLNIRWRLARGMNMKSLMTEGATSAAPAPAATRAVLALGRRDVFIFSWMVLAAVKLLPVALLWALLIALSCFVTAVGQVVTSDPAVGGPHS